MNGDSTEKFTLTITGVTKHAGEPGLSSSSYASHSRAGLNDGPIRISIETKQQHRTGDAAELQISTWHMEQWEMLSQMAIPLSGGLGGYAFLPGVILSGHDWYLVVRMREREKTILWNDVLFGLSRSVVGSYKIIRGLQDLMRDGLTWY